MMMRLVLVCCLCCFVLGCTKDSNEGKTTIRFWHFWSEPAQRKALEAIVKRFEEKHPGVHVELTALQWSDGKSKLHLAFNAGTQPDVLHLGLDWLAEFAEAGVLDTISSGVDTDIQFGPYAIPWFVNARALVQWTGSHPAYKWGLCATDPHNVIKRTLPLLWRWGAPQFYTRMPLQADMNEALVHALDSLRLVAHDHALIAPSRDLDQSFLRGEVYQMYTGSWIMGMAKERGITSYRVEPTVSILNGDVLCATTKSSKKALGREFAQYLASMSAATRFTDEVVDAGVSVAWINRLYLDFVDRNPFQGFFDTLKESVPVATSATLLDAEPIIEDMIVRCYDARSIEDVRSIVADARSRLK